MKEGYFTYPIGAVGGVLAWMFGGVDAVIITLGVFMLADYITGLLKGAIAKKLDSSIGFNGLARKGLIIFVVFMAAQLDAVLGLKVFRSMACVFYIANEGISILENAAAAGVPLPPGLLAYLQKMKATAEQKATVIPDEVKLIEKPPAE